MNVLEVIQSATGYLDKHGVESPRLSAEHLLAHALQMQRLDLYMSFDRPVSESERAPLRELVRRRAAGVPLQHLLGSWDFYGRTFRCDARALIPRPETELLVEWILETNPADSPAPHVLDVGTGTGVLAITLALENPHWLVTGTDISPSALELARENAALLGIPDRLTFVEADLVPPGTTWNLIVANPPYIPTAEIAALSREVQHDPLLALDGGPAGLSVYERLLPLSLAALPPGGWLFLEIGHGQDQPLLAAAEEAGFAEATIRQDHQGTGRLLRARKPLSPGDSTAPAGTQGSPGHSV
jgi:release factor glutamine methyltransferase